MILDPSSDRNNVKAKLSKLHEKMEEMQKMAFTYKSYQKNFKVRPIF